MAPVGPDASNSCLPPKHPVLVSCPPVPSCTRGERCPVEGRVGRLNQGRPILAYASGKLVVARTLDGQPVMPQQTPLLPVLCYRGHHHPVTALQFTPSGAYVASGDERGTLRIWSFDHEEHLCKYECAGLNGTIRDLAWDGDSQKIALCGERTDPSSECAKVLQWDTGVSVGQLAQHLKGRVAALTIKPNRPYRLVTAGKDDTKTYFHKGPPFQKIPSENGIPMETAHTKGAITSIRYDPSGDWVVSVSTDRAICIYDGKTLELRSKVEQVHDATIYDVAWSSDGKYLMTASGDGTCKLFEFHAKEGTIQQVHVWKPAEFQYGKSFEKVPVGGIQLGCTFVAGTLPTSVGLNGQICLLPPLANPNSTIQVLTGHYATVDAVALDRSRKLFFTGDSDGIMCQWDMTKCLPLRRIESPEGNDDLMNIVHGGAIAGLACLADGTLLSVGWDDKLFLTPPGSTVAKTDPIALGAQPTAVAAGTKLAVVSTVEGLLTYTITQGLSSMITVPYQCNTVCVASNDQTVFVGGGDCKIHIYNVATGGTLKENHVIENGHLKPLQSLALSTDGTKLAAGDERDICVWDLSDSYKAIIGRGRWCFHVQRVTSLAWSPDDSVLVSGGADESIYMWSLEKKMKRVHYPYAHRGGITGLEFIGEGYKFLSVGKDSVTNLWDVTDDIKDKFS